MDIRSAFTNIPLMETLVNNQAKSLCKKYGINPEHFQVHLSSNLNGNISKIVPGHIVHIYLQWPESFFTLNSVLNDNLGMINRLKLRRTMEIVPFALVKAFATELRSKWKKEVFTDESDIVLDMLPRHRLKIVESTTITLEDSITGECISVTKSGKKQRFEGEDVTLWMQLSRIVRDKHPILETIETENKENENASNG